MSTVAEVTSEQCSSLSRSESTSVTASRPHTFTTSLSSASSGNTDARVHV